MKKAVRITPQDKMDDLGPVDGAADQPQAGRRGSSPDRLLSIPAEFLVAPSRKQDGPRGISSQRAVDLPARRLSGAAHCLLFVPGRDHAIAPLLASRGTAEVGRPYRMSRHPVKRCQRSPPPRVRWYAALSECEHLLQHRQCPTEAGRRDPSEATHEALPINRSDLVQHDVSDPSAEPTRDSKWIRMAAGGHGGHDEGAKVGVQLIRGNDHTWARLLDFSATGGIETHQKDVTAPDSLGPHHFHSLSSKRVEMRGSGSASSPR